MVNQCQHDVKCSTVAGWKDESNSVAYIEITYPYNGDVYTNHGTAFFINKVGDYELEDEAYFVSVGHFFCLNGIDISTSYIPQDVKVYVGYLNSSCNSTIETGGTSIGSVSRILLGSGYCGPTSPLDASDDFSFWKTNSTTEDLMFHEIKYAGWDAIVNYYLEGYAALGHPGGDVMKVLIDDERGWWNGTDRRWTLYFDKGMNEDGFSGSPVFDNRKLIVGWVQARDIEFNYTCENNFVEDENGIISGVMQTINGVFQHLWDDINTYIDPNLDGIAESYVTPIERPGHCSDCVKNEDEEEIDCGGSSCFPCGTREHYTLASDYQLIDNSYIIAKQNLTVDPQSSSDLFIHSGIDYKYTAGQNVTITGDFKASQGVSLRIETDESLLQQPNRGCQGSCYSLTYWGFSPNGDGVNEYLQITQAFISKYSIEVYWAGGSGAPSLIYSEYDIDIYRNGKINVWDGSGGIADEPYIVEFTLTDCNGYTWTEEEWPVYVCPCN